MKVKRYEYYTPPMWDMDSYMREKDDGDWIGADDYTALLALARRLRRMLFVSQDPTAASRVVLDDSAWLEE